MKFYKGALKSSFINRTRPYLPGTVTTDINEALLWKERLQSKKTKGIHRNITHGESVVIEIIYDGEIACSEEFQRSDVPEHQRGNCWTSVAKTKAQLNTPCSFRILSLEEIEMIISQQANQKWARTAKGV